MSGAAMLELALVEKTGGALTKRISLDDTGAIKSDGSACVMLAGDASRLRLADVGALADAIHGFRPYHALTLGRLRPGLPDTIRILTKRRINDNNAADAVARTADNFMYEAGRPGLVLLDFDTKGMPPEVDELIKSLGGFEAAIASVLPELQTTQRLIRASTSAGLYRSDTSERLPASNGLHQYLLIRDGADAERFLRALHVRLFLAGLGWLMLGRAGHLLERSIVDRLVAAPERLVFEGPPILVSPVAQDAVERQPRVFDGGPLDSVAACPPLTILEQSDFKSLCARLRTMLAPQAEKRQAEFVREHAERLARAKNVGADKAKHVVERQCHGVLLPDFVLEFDDPDLAGTTVADVFTDPDKYVGETLADPLEGIDYGRCKARIMRRADGSLWIHSFAHGRTIYELKLDYVAAEKAISDVDAKDAPNVYVRVALAADLTGAELEQLRNLVAQRAGVGKRTLDSMLKQARREAADAAAKRRREEQGAARQDPRPQASAPLPDAEWLPVMRILNEAHSSSKADEPPMRDREGDLAHVKTSEPTGLHLLTSDGNVDLPAPPQALIAKMSEVEAAEMIERHVEFLAETDDGDYRPVHLGAPFVKHFMRRTDRALPPVTGVSSLPIVLSNGDLLSGRGLDRRSGIVFRVPPNLWLPATEDCDTEAISKAMQFLCDEWLCDVATDYEGKCVIIACALTIIERMALPERPAFFIVAGQRGGGKTTTLHLISTAVLGTRAAAAAWSPNDEERRKALFAYLSAGLPFLVWDNIPLGAAIGCPSIEKALTAETYTDRVLGVSEFREAPAYTVMAFTGNNITARGDLASRALSARITVDRPDPENRKFKHADPIAWTEQHRADILSALFTILLGNPRVKSPKQNTPAETRFKVWWHLVGAGIEHAAGCHAEFVNERGNGGVTEPGPCPPKKILFKNLFLNGEKDDEQSASLIEIINYFKGRHGTTEYSKKSPYETNSFQASDVVGYCRSLDLNDIAFKSHLEMAAGKAIPFPTVQVVSARLRSCVDRPVEVGGELMALRFERDKQGGRFWVARRASAA
jgi:hypothetical protein